MFGYMNRPAVIITFLFLLATSVSFSQTGYLFVKKGIKKKRIYTEGDAIQLRLQDGSLLNGYITLLRNDTLFINGRPVHKTGVKEVLLPKKAKKPFPDAKTVALIAAGSALTSVGLAINDKENRTEALIAGPVIGFGPLLLKHFGGRAIRAIPRKKFRIGKKFYLQVLDFHISPQTQRLKTF
ncbi:MAG: hypothetical protein JNK14_06255 [Chitinophagaceae bacterium]|nr:hypothetical protein [Chitinophagaceae bacterium]